MIKKNFQQRFVNPPRNVNTNWKFVHELGFSFLPGLELKITLKIINKEDKIASTSKMIK